MRRVALILALCALIASPARAETVVVLTTGAFKQVAAAIAEPFAATTGHRLDLRNDTAGAIVKRLQAGEPCDVVILTPGALKPFAENGTVRPGSIVPLARVGIGVAVKAGAPRVDISTVDDFKQAVLAAKRVAYIDPAAGGSSGIYLDGLFQRLGIADAVRAKAVLVPGGLVAERLVDGQADLAIHQISEILPVPGVMLVGPLPEAIQNYTSYAGAVSATAARADLAAAFLAALSGPDAARVIQAKGMTPAQ